MLVLLTSYGLTSFGSSRLTTLGPLIPTRFLPFESYGLTSSGRGLFITPSFTHQIYRLFRSNMLKNVKICIYVENNCFILWWFHFFIYLCRGNIKEHVR